MSKYINANMAMKAIEHWARYVCRDDKVPIEDIRTIFSRMSGESFGFELTYGQKKQSCGAGGVETKRGCRAWLGPMNRARWRARLVEAADD